MDALQTAKSLANLAEGREGPESNEQAALLAVTYAVIALTEQVRDTNTNTNSILEDIARYVGINYRQQTALMAVEYVLPPWPTFTEDGHKPFCPWCGLRQGEGHRADCLRQMAVGI